MGFLATPVAQGAKSKLKKAKKLVENDSKKKKEKVVPKVDALKKSFKKEKVKKVEKNISASKKELIKKSLAEKGESKVVNLEKGVPAKVLKAKNNVAKTSNSLKPVVKVKKVKNSKKVLNKENKAVKVESPLPAKKSKKEKAGKTTSVITTKKPSVVTKGEKKGFNSKNLENVAAKGNIKSTRQSKKQICKSTETKKNKDSDEKSKVKKITVAAKKDGSRKKSKVESEKLVEIEKKEEIKNIKSKKRKLPEAEMEEELEDSSVPPSKKEILKYVKGLLKYTENEEKKKKPLLESEKPPVLLQVTCIKIPKAPLHQLRILLPHSMVKPTDDVALLVTDLKKGRRIDFEPTVRHYEDLLREHGCTGIKTIIPMNQVKTEYRQFEMRRKLLGLYDFFLIDGRISGHMAHILGKSFREKRKLPISIHMGKKDLKAEVETALRKTSLEIHSTGDSSTVQIGTCSMSAEKLTDNIVAVIEKLGKDYPGGWENIRSLRIKTPLGLAIPIYITLKSRNTVEVPDQQPKRPKAYQIVKGELSTFTDNVEAIVGPDGTVAIRKLSNEKDLEDDTSKADKKPSNVKKRGKVVKDNNQDRGR